MNQKYFLRPLRKMHPVRLTKAALQHAHSEMLSEKIYHLKRNTICIPRAKKEPNPNGFGSFGLAALTLRVPLLAMPRYPLRHRGDA